MMPAPPAAECCPHRSPRDGLRAVSDAAGCRLASLLAAGRGADLALLEAAADLLQSRMPGRGYGDLPAGLSAMAAGDQRFGVKLSALLLSCGAAGHPRGAGYGRP